MKRAERKKHTRRVPKPAKKQPEGGSISGEAASRALAIAADLSKTVGASAIEFVPITAIRPNPRNARRHTSDQIERLAASIGAFGFIGALIIDDANELLAGHARLKALKLLGYEVVPCIRTTNLTKEAKEAFAIADNQLALLATWDDPLLKDILSELSTKDLEFELEATGFDTVELDLRTGPEPDPYARSGDADGFSTDPDDLLTEPTDDEPAVSRLGDIWLAKDHRILCGDALDPKSYRALLLDSAPAIQMVTETWQR
ncbi:MAG: ParB/Srx family N-terminal domain-containing protein [Bauldia sp.]